MSKTTDVNKLLELKTFIDRKIDGIIKGVMQPNEYEVNTINDFYEDTEAMIKDLFNLFFTKMDDFFDNGKRYTKTAVLEICGQVAKYVMTYAHGDDFVRTPIEQRKEYTDDSIK